jgi:hypothetical protein
MRMERACRLELDGKTSVIAHAWPLSRALGGGSAGMGPAPMRTEVCMSRTTTAAEAIAAETSLKGNEGVSESAPETKTEASKHSRPRRKSSRSSRGKKRRTSATAASKQEIVLQMLRRKSGASIDDLVSKTEWQPHSVRGFLSGVARKKLKLPLVSEVGKDGVRRYRVASPKPVKP